MRDPRLLPSLSLAIPLLGGLLAPAQASALPLTGDAEADFTASDVVVVPDPAGIDVGIPLVFPSGTVSGNDIKDIRFSYEAATDTLFVAFNTYVIAGDVDGDGDPDGSGSALVGLGGIDSPFFGGTESFALVIDVDQDGVLDVIAGVSAFADLSAFTVSVFSGSPMTPSLAFGAPLPGHTGPLFGAPSPSAPDLEFAITDVSGLPTSSGSDPYLSFSFMAFMGSFSDAGIGEDFIPSMGATVPVDFPEVCDGADNDGDGVVDEGAADCDGDLGGRVFLDLDKDGEQGADEPGISGVEVLLTGPDCDGDGAADVLSVFTDGAGDYLAEGLCQGEWVAAPVGQDYDVFTTPPSALVIVVSGETAQADFGICRRYVTLTPGYWKNHRCSVEPYLPITMGALTFTTFEEVSEYLGRPAKGDKTLKLGQHLLSALLNNAAFGDAPFIWGDFDGDGSADTVGDLIAAGAAAFVGGDTSLQNALAGELDVFNNSGETSDLPDFFPGCAAEGQGGSGNGNGGGKGKGNGKSGKKLLDIGHTETLIDSIAGCDSGAGGAGSLLGLLLLGLPALYQRRRR